MKKILLTALCFAAMASAHADDLLNMAFTTSDGDIVMSSSGMIITFDNGYLVAANEEEKRSFSLSDVTKFYFTTEATGITTLEADSTEPVTVYTLTGQQMGTFAAGDNLQGRLGKGTYVVKGNNTSKKLIVR